MSEDINEVKYDPADDDLVATEKDKASAKLNIIVQLRKSMDVRGNMAIKFADGKSQKIPMNIMKIALDKFSKVRKPDSKEKMQTAMSKSYKDMIMTLKTFKETVWSNSLGREVLDEASQVLAQKKITESYESMNASVDKVKIQKQIDQAEKYLKTFFGNTSSVKTKKFAIQKKIEKLKTQLKEESLLDHELMINEAIDFRKAHQEIMAYAKKSGGIDKTDFEKVAYYVKAIGDNQNTPNVANKAFMAMKKFVGDMDTDPRDGVMLMLKKHGMFKNGRMVQEAMSPADKEVESIEGHIEEGFSQREIKMAIGIASDKRYAGNNMSGAVRAIEKLKKGLSDQSQVSAVLKRQNEEVELDEGKELTYTVVHAKKGKVVVTATTSYDAAKKAAKQWKLKSTAGIDSYLMKEETLDEAPNYKLYHNTFSGAVQEAIAVAKKQGFDVDEDDWSNKVATGPKKPSKDKTNSYSIKLLKGGKPVKKLLQIQVYNMGAKYELNCYVQ